MTTIVALLPMKAHSERVSGKNFRDMNGKPLYQWILDTLLSIDEIDRIVINTDAADRLSDGISGNEQRILVRDRVPELCGDLVSMNCIIDDDMRAVPADIYLMTHTTNPLLTSNTVRGALQYYCEAVGSGSADSVFTVNKVQTRFYRADGSAVNHDPEDLIRTQDLEPWFEENSNLYVFSTSSFEASGARIGTNPAMFVMDSTEAIDIDDQAGWDLAEAVQSFLMHKHRRRDAS